MVDEEQGEGPPPEDEGADDVFVDGQPVEDDPSQVGTAMTDGESGEERTGGRGLWLLIGGVLLVLGLGAGAAAAYTRFSDDGTDQQGSRTTTTTTSAQGGSKGKADATTTTAAGAAPAKEARWPVAVGGRPSAFGVDGDPPPAETDLADGFYLWLDFTGWHLWIVGGVGSDASVDIRSDDTFTVATPTGGEPDLLQEGNHLIFQRGGAEERVVGVDFNPGFYGRTMVVTTAGDLPMHLGTQGVLGAQYLGLQESTAN